MSDSVPARIPAATQDLLNLMGRQVANQQMNAVVRLSGQIDETRLARAIRLSLDAEPVLGCRLVLDSERPYWERRDDLDFLPHAVTVESTDIEADLWSFVGQPVDPTTDPRIQARIFRSAGSADTLCVKVDHLAADVGGTKQYLGLLGTIYRALGDDSSYRPEPNAGSRSQDQVFRQFDSAALAGLAPDFGRPPAWGFPVAGRDAAGASYAIRRLAPDRLARLKAFGRERGATVNDLLLTALYRSFHEVVSGPFGVPLTVQVPIDLRRYLPEHRAEAVCNLSMMLYPEITLEPRDDFGSTLGKVVGAMAPYRSGCPGLGTALFLERAFGAGFSEVARRRPTGGDPSATPKANPLLSNFGVLDPSGFDFGGGAAGVIDAFLVGPVVFPPSLMVAVSSFNDVLTLTVGYPSCAADGMLVERLLDRLAEWLPQ